MSNMNESQEMVKLTINNIPIEVPKGTKIMQAAKVLGIDIPHLCYHEDQRIKAHCRLCSVEVTGKKRLLAACSTEVWEGMDVHTDTQIVRDTQVSILQLMLANHHKDCLSCPRNQNCDLQRLCSRFNILKSNLPSVVKEVPRIETNPSIVRDPSKCIRCGRCIRACKDVQGIAALTYAGRSSDIVVTTAFNKPWKKPTASSAASAASSVPPAPSWKRTIPRRCWTLCRIIPSTLSYRLLLPCA